MNDQLNTSINPLRHFLPLGPHHGRLQRDVADLRVADPHKQQFFEHLLPAGADLRLLVRYPRPRMTRARLLPSGRGLHCAEIELHVTRRDPGGPAGDEREHWVQIHVDEHGLPMEMFLGVGFDDIWRHSARTAERTLRRLARKDPELLCALPDDADPRERHRAEIDRLDDIVYSRRDEAYVERAWLKGRAYVTTNPLAGRVANPDADPKLRDTMRQLAEAMLDRDGKLPAWWTAEVTAALVAA